MVVGVCTRKGGIEEQGREKKKIVVKLRVRESERGVLLIPLGGIK